MFLLFCVIVWYLLTFCFCFAIFSACGCWLLFSFGWLLVYVVSCGLFLAICLFVEFAVVLFVGLNCELRVFYAYWFVFVLVCVFVYLFACLCALLVLFAICNDVLITVCECVYFYLGLCVNLLRIM